MSADEEMMQRRRLAHRVDPGDLSREEQETWISFRGDEDRFQFGSYVPTIVRSILRHAEAQIEWCYVRPVDGRRSLERDIAAIARGDPDDRIEGVEATLPLGALTVKGSPRKRDIVSTIVNTPEDAEAAREAFDDAEDGHE